MEPILNAKPFEILVTHVEKEHGLVKIFGQVDLKTSQVVEKYLAAVEEQLEGGSPPLLSSLQVGQVIVVRRERGWYRGKVVAVDSNSNRVVVFLVDHGATVPLALANIRTGVHSQLSQLQPLSVSYFLGEVVPPAGDWSKPAIEFISDAVVGTGGTCRALMTHRGHGHSFVRLYCRESREPLSHDMVQCGMAVSGLPNIDFLPPAQNYVQPQVSPVRPGQGPPPLSIRVPPLPPASVIPPQPLPSVIFRPMHLETGQWYPVYLSSTEGGPGDFCVQLASLASKLEEVMLAANKTKLTAIPPGNIQAGVPCLARYSLDNTIYRAVVLKKDSSAKVYYLDYGNSEQVRLEEVYSMPGDQLATQMLSVRCSVFQWPTLSREDRQKARLRLESYSDKVLQCRVVSTETGGSFASARTVVQLYDDNQDIGQEIRLWLSRPGTVEDWKPEGAGSSSFSYVTISGQCEVFLSHPGAGPSEFYVSRADSSAALSAVMRDIHQLSHQGSIFPLTTASPGLSCLARYEDGVWYRARVETVSQDRGQRTVTVYYVDYGNTATLPLSSLAVIPDSLVTALPGQAVHCRLSGLESEPELADRWTSLLTERLSLKVEGVDCGVHVVQAFTTPAPGVNLNQELGRRAVRGVVGVGEVQELLVTWVESTNSWYGQLARSDVKEFLARLSEETSRASPLYRDSRHHNKGQTCAVPDTRSQGRKFLRGVVTREHKDSVEVRLMDVGGREKFYKKNVYCLPSEFSRRPEYGIICSFGCNPALTDNKFKDCMMNSLIEVKVLKKIGDGVEVILTNSKSRKLKNSSVSSVLELLSSDSSYEARLKSLYEKQNNKYSSRQEGGETNGGSAVFERGDLRNSLREKRAARERHERTAGGSGLSMKVFKSGWKGEGKITWMYSPAHFYLQVAGDGRDSTVQFEEMMSRLQEAMVTRRQEAVKVGQVVAARWQDDCWYRGQVIAVRQSKMEIFFVDFGNTEKVDKEDLAVLPAEFFHLHCQAVRVSLAGVEADWEKLNGKVAKFFDKDSFSVEIVGQKDADGAYPVQLNDGEIIRAMLKQKLVQLKEGSDIKNGKKQKKERNEKEASSDSDMRSERDQSQGKLQDGKVSKAAKLRKAGKLFCLGDFPGIPSTDFVGGSVSGKVSHFVSWKQFWLQLQPELAEELTARLNTGEISSLHGRLVKSIEVGECCLVNHLSVWHRASVTSKCDGGAGVEALLVDCGLTVRLPLSQVRDGQFQLYDQKPLALRCRLDNKIDNFEKFIDSQERKISGRVKNFKDNTFLVKVDKMKKDKKEELQEVVVVHVESVDKVWLVEKEKMSSLSSMMVQLSSTNPGQLENPSPGSLCCVRYSEDGELYRARLVEVGDQVVTVQYIDYGNTEEVEADQVLELVEEFKEMEEVAKLVTVKSCGLALDCEKSRTKLEKTLSLSGEKLSVSTDSGGEVTFWSGGHKVDVMKALSCVKDESLHMFRVSSSPRVSCIVSHVEGEKVWLKLTCLEVEQRLNNSLQERARRLSKAGKVHVGDFVVARYSGDRKYYRARVVRMVGAHKAELLYIDYGNKEIVDVGWLKTLPVDLRLCPGLAGQWRLDSSHRQTEVSCEGELRRVTGPELLNSEVTADLVQPRSRIVSLWLGGVRLALTSVSASLPVRLRPAETWLALITSSQGEVVSLLNLYSASNISHLLKFYGTEIDVSKPVVGKVYCQTLTGGLRRRVVVTERGRQMVTVSALDSHEEDTVSSSSLETLVPRLASASPASISCRPNTAERCLLSDKLVLVTVNSSSTVKMVEMSLKVSPTFTSSRQVGVSSQLSLSPEGDNLLSVSLPSGTWTSNSLSQVRDMLLQAALGLSISPGSKVVTKSEGFPCELSDSLGVNAEPELVSPSPHPEYNLVSKLFKSSPLDVGSLRIISQDGNISVSSYSDIVPQDLSSTEDAFTVVELLEKGRAILRKNSSVTRFPGSDLKTAESIEESKLYLYKEDDDDAHVVRVFTKKTSDESSVADVRAIDSGRAYLCQYSELYQMTSELYQVPVAVIPARIVSERRLDVGDQVNGKFSTSDNKLELELQLQN